jgi:hypothetical protein
MFFGGVFLFGHGSDLTSNLLYYIHYSLPRAASMIVLRLALAQTTY